MEHAEAPALKSMVIQRLLICNPEVNPSAAATITAADGPYNRSVRKTKVSATPIVVFTRGTWIAIRELMTTVSKNSKTKRTSKRWEGNRKAEYAKTNPPVATISHM